LGVWPARNVKNLKEYQSKYGFKRTYNASQNHRTLNYKANPTKHIMPRTVSYAPEAEALYRSILYAADKYKAKMGPVQKNHGFRFPEVLPLYHKTVKLQALKLAYKLASKFRHPNAMENLDTKIHDYVEKPQEDDLRSGPTMFEWQSDRAKLPVQMKIQEAFAVIARNSVKASQAAVQELHASMADYAEAENLDYTKVPKGLMKIVQSFEGKLKRLEKKAAKMASASEKKAKKLAKVVKALPA
jgi:hypothetical protein